MKILSAKSVQNSKFGINSVEGQDHRKKSRPVGNKYLTKKKKSYTKRIFKCQFLALTNRCMARKTVRKDLVVRLLSTQARKLIKFGHT